MSDIGRIFFFASLVTTFGFVPFNSAAAIPSNLPQPSPNSKIPTLSQNDNYVMKHDSNGNLSPLGNSGAIILNQFEGRSEEPKWVFQCFKGTLCDIDFAKLNVSTASNLTVLTYLTRHNSWMIHKRNLTFTGFPPHKGLSQYILYTSSSGENREIPFQVRVKEYPAPNHMFDVVMKTPSAEQLQVNPQMFYWLVNDLSAALHGDISSITVQHIRGVGNYTEISFFNNTLSVEDCDQNAIGKMWNYIFSENNDKIRKHFIRLFGLYHEIHDVSLERTGDCAKRQDITDTSTSSSTHSEMFTKSPAEIVAAVFSWKTLVRTLAAVVVAVGLTVIIVVATMGWKKRNVEEQRNEEVELGIINPLHGIEQTEIPQIEPTDLNTHTTIESGVDEHDE
ncbi:CBN-DGN-2 protein [Caenorhabditis brenneri]|uniref:CBN-DGN-2 protein n=1 Tax=Caenorhabditis brenneri TaxID=135651 RepID=G0MH60_CAEBE|nr:CBN-DGN-2 protein [Caenorhabditis brenneri]